MPDADDIQVQSNTVERWALDLIECTSLQRKLAPPVTPSQWTSPSPAAIRIKHPGRPEEFDLIGKTRRSIKKHQLVSPRWRAHLLHTFLHHELQAAELMAWAILAFPDTPEAFRQGLLKICKRYSACNNSRGEIVYNGIYLRCSSNHYFLPETQFINGIKDAPPFAP